MYTSTREGPIMYSRQILFALIIIFTATPLSNYTWSRGGIIIEFINANFSKKPAKKIFILDGGKIYVIWILLPHPLRPRTLRKIAKLGPFLKIWTAILKFQPFLRLSNIDDSKPKKYPIVSEKWEPYLWPKSTYRRSH